MSETSHKEVLERFDNHWRFDRINRDDALEDLKFRAGDQWRDDVRRMRELDGRPVLTINRMGQFVKRVAGSIRQSRPAIEAVPSDDQSDKVLADIYEGLIRQIEYGSSADAVYAWGAECAITCGIGHWRVDSQYTDGDSFDQEICIKRILDPLAVVWDASAENLDRSDAEEAFITEWVTLDEYKRRWPKEKRETPSDFPVPDALLNTGLYWRTDKRVRIASHWYKNPTKRHIGMTQDGQVFDLSKLEKNAAQFLGIVRDRVIEDYEIKHRVVGGNDFLTDQQDWAGRNIPIVPVIGEEIAFDGKVVRHGIVRFAKDPQRLFNYYRSAAAEALGAAPKAPWLIADKSIEGHEREWAKANTGNPPYLTFNPLIDFPGLRPERMQPPVPPTALWSESAQASDDMKATTGVYDAALGNSGNEVSGVAIEQRQHETETGSFVYFDNFNQAIKRTGVILVDLIPRIYDSERVVRVLGKGAQEAFVPINKVVMDLNGPVLVNDLTAGKFDVRIKTGPNYTNSRDQAREQLGRIIQADPNLMNVIGDIYFSKMDFDGAKELEARMKRVIPPQVTGEPPDPSTQAPPDPMAEAVKQLSVAGLHAKVTGEQAKADGMVLDNHAKAQTLQGPLAHLAVAKADADVKHTQALADKETIANHLTAHAAGL
jgi:hypothetical protein